MNVRASVGTSPDILSLIVSQCIIFPSPWEREKNTSNEQNIGWHYLLNHRRKDVFWPLGFYTSYGLI